MFLNDFGGYYRGNLPGFWNQLPFYGTWNGQYGNLGTQIPLNFGNGFTHTFGNQLPYGFTNHLPFTTFGTQLPYTFNNQLPYTTLGNHGFTPYGFFNTFQNCLPNQNVTPFIGQWNPPQGFQTTGCR